VSTLDLGQPLQGAANSDRTVPVRAWLWLVAVMVFAMVVVGGATRLTGSGLSITEWRPVSGAIPPLGDAAWQQAFSLYKASPQYALVNQGMTLAEFKFIYWWEWGHRQLGRTIGLVYVAGLVLALAGRRVDRRKALLLVGMGLLLGVQGFIGWIMVASGLEPGMTAVEPVKLALHLTFAALFFASVVAMAVSLAPARPRVGPMPRGRALAFVGVVLLQIALGGLVAGSHAGFIYNTWPLMDGAIIPDASLLFRAAHWAEDFVDNVALVQLNHRLVAYVVLAFALWQWLGARGLDRRYARRTAALLGLVLGQVALGVATLLLVVPLHAALTHQALAFVVLAMAVVHWAAAMRDQAASA